MRDLAISLQSVAKYYKLYNGPKDRLKEALNPFGKKYHHEFYALKDINLEIEKGEILGVVGRNGSGKSTLLKLICGVLSPNAGCVHVEGKISALLELGAGFNPEFTGYENIYFYATVLGLSKHEVEDKLDDIIDFADLGEFMSQPIKTYSSGMKARLGFAVAVHIEPEILILDEVLAVGDILFRRKCYAKMNEFFKGGKTIIYTSHDASSINELCTRAIFIHEGTVLMDGEPKLVTSYYQKLLFSTDENRGKVLDEIKAFSKAPSQPESCEGKEIEQEPEEVSAFYSGEEYLPGFVSVQKVEMSNFQVSIEDSYIVNDKETRVNVLVYEQKYKYICKVSFSEVAEHVSFGAQISSLKGVLISGAALWHGDDCISVVANGDVYLVEWYFTCRLLEGVYFLTPSCSALVEGERVILARIADAFMFKVLPKEKSLCRGIVGLNEGILVKKLVGG